MSFNDPISDLLTRIRNGKDAKHRFVDASLSKMILGVVKILKEKGFIENYIINEELKKVRIFLKYVRGRRSIIQGLTRVSKPGLRRYVGADQIPMVFSGLGISIVSTNKGIVDGERARKERVGGELLCKIW